MMGPASGACRDAHSSWSKRMTVEWIASSLGLPHEGEPVEFFLDGRDVALEGTYVRQIFRSRWNGYEVDRVNTWRSSEARAHAAA
jgi:hypothetical protein